jgi:hypothetical protein
MFKVSRVVDSASLKEARAIMRRIYDEHPDHWPHGLSADHFDDGCYLIREKRSSTPVGFAGFQRRWEFDGDSPKRVGFYSIGILPEYRQNGFAKEAIGKLISMKSAGVDRVKALIVKGNTPSLRLASSLGVPAIVKSATTTQTAQRHPFGLKDVGAIGGAALLGDTWNQSRKAVGYANKMTALHEALAKRKFADMQDPDAFYGLMHDYGTMAQGALKTRVFGVPFHTIGSAFPLSRISTGDQTKKLSIAQLLNHYSGNRPLDPETTKSLEDAYGHYAGYSRNPSEIQFREFTTGNSIGSAHQITGGMRTSGITPEKWGEMLKSSDPMKALMSHIKLSPYRKVALRDMYENFGKGLLTDNQPAAEFFAGKMPVNPFGGGPAAYGRGIIGAARQLRPLAGAGALGLAGYEAYRRTKKASAQLQRKDRETAAAGLLGGAGLASSARRYRPSNLILSTGGHLKEPVAWLDTGAGHITPARAMAELLRQHPAVQSGDFSVGEAYRTMNEPYLKEWHQGKGMLGPENSKTLSPISNLVHGFSDKFINPFTVKGMEKSKPHALMMLEHGMGGNQFTFGGAIRNPQFTWHPKGGVGFVSDFVHDPSDIAQKDTLLNVGGYLNKMPAITFGKPQSPNKYGPLLKPLINTSVHPLLQQKVIDNAREWLVGKRNPADVWHNLASGMKATDPEGSARLTAAVQTGKKIVTVSGSSRGDLVAHRAADLQRELRANGLDGHFQVVAALGNAHNHPQDLSHRLLDHYPEVVRIGHTANYPGADMTDLVHASDFHWGSTGASAHAEAMLSATPTAFVTRFNDSPEGPGGLDNQLREMQARGLDTSHFEHMRSKGYNLDSWNRGLINHIKTNMAGKELGVESANNAKELLPFLRRMSGGEIMRYADRASHQLNATEFERRRLSDALIEHAAVLRSGAANARLMRLGAGGALAGAGLYALGKSQMDRPPVQGRFADAIQRFSNLFHQYQR